MFDGGQFAADESQRRAAGVGPSQPLGSLTLAIAAARSKNYADAAALLTGMPANGINRVLVPMLRAWAIAGSSGGDAGPGGGGRVGANNLAVDEDGVGGLRRGGAGQQRSYKPNCGKTLHSLCRVQSVSMNMSLAPGGWRRNVRICL